MSNKRFVAIDAGKGNTKVSRLYANGDVQRFRFPTITRPCTLDDDVSAGQFIVTVDDVPYLVGAPGTKHSNALDTSKANVTHKACTLAAIAKICDNGDDVYAVIGCPANIYNNPKTREDYRQYLLPEKEYKVSFVDGDTGIKTTKAFAVKKSLVLCEGTGITFSNPELFHNDDATAVGIIDCGNLNINALYFDNGTPVREMTVTNSNGFNKLISLICDELSNAFGETINTRTIETIMNSKDTSKRAYRIAGNPSAAKESPAVFAHAIAGYVDRLFIDLKSAGWDLANASLVFVGGTSACLRQEINDYCIAQGYDYNLVFPEMPEYANSDGFLQALKMMLVKRGIL